MECRAPLLSLPPGPFSLKDLLQLGLVHRTGFRAKRDLPDGTKKGDKTFEVLLPVFRLQDFRKGLEKECCGEVRVWKLAGRNEQWHCRRARKPPPECVDAAKAPDQGSGAPPVTEPGPSHLHREITRRATGTTAAQGCTFSVILSYTSIEPGMVYCRFPGGILHTGHEAGPASYIPKHVRDHMKELIKVETTSSSVLCKVAEYVGDRLGPSPGMCEPSRAAAVVEHVKVHGPPLALAAVTMDERAVQSVRASVRAEGDGGPRNDAEAVEASVGGESVRALARELGIATGLRRSESAYRKFLRARHYFKDHPGAYSLVGDATGSNMFLVKSECEENTPTWRVVVEDASATCDCPQPPNCGLCRHIYYVCAMALRAALAEVVAGVRVQPKAPLGSGGGVGSGGGGGSDAGCGASNAAPVRGGASVSTSSVEPQSAAPATTAAKRVPSGHELVAKIRALVDQLVAAGAADRLQAMLDVGLQPTSDVLPAKRPNRHDSREGGATEVTTPAKKHKTQ